MKQLLALSLIVGAFFAIATATTPFVTTDVPAPMAIGTAVDNFTLPDSDGKDQSLSSLKGKNGTVVIFVATKCPVSNAYNERMEKLAQEYKAKGISVVGINSNSAELAAEIKAHATANKLTFPILKDGGNKIADVFGATVTPEAFFLDATNKLVYRGRIDNARDVSQVVSTELRDAMEAALAGKPVAKTTATAFGCSIKRA